MGVGTKGISHDSAWTQTLRNPAASQEKLLYTFRVLVLVKCILQTGNQLTNDNPVWRASESTMTATTTVQSFALNTTITLSKCIRADSARRCACNVARTYDVRWNHNFLIDARGTHSTSERCQWMGNGLWLQKGALRHRSKHEIGYKCDGYARINRWRQYTRFCTLYE